ncbi:MAG TPA: RNA polymerase sigma-70 factor [Puia sp.]|jgi:RNA polymerase sigma-70 factor (ECF subfamily)|nr:RNA polymerase sigma-70 factor [Puia sp.]
MIPEEEKTWRSIQTKDQQVFERYYKEHYKFFFLVACQYLGEAASAQEVVNDVYLRLWQDAEKIAIQSSLRSYLYRMVVNRCLNELDKSKRERRQQAEAGRRIDEAVEWKEMEDAELRLRLYQAIDRLPEQCRKVFQMSRFRQLKQQEIADRLGISIKTVKNHITYALRQLRQALDEWNGLPVWMAVIRYFFWRH